MTYAIPETPRNPTQRLASFVTKHWLWLAVIAAAVFILPILITPFAYFIWNYPQFRSLFHDRLGASESVASVLAVAATFLYVTAFPLAARWLFVGRQKPRAVALSFVAIMAIFASKPLLMAIGSTPFTATGKAQRCYAWRDHQIALIEAASGTCGADPVTGEPTQPITPQIAEMYRRQQSHASPKLISADPRTVAFYDGTTGQPLVWYSRGADGKVRLFDSSGFDPDSGVPLKPITPQLVSDAKAEAEADAAAATARQLAANAVSAGDAAAQSQAPVPPATGAASPDLSTSSLAAGQDDSESGNAAVDAQAATVAKEKAVSFYQTWSGSDAQSVLNVRPYFADTVLFYGSTLSLDDLMTKDLQFANRWPVRRYVVRAESLTSKCFPDHACLIAGLVDWNASSPADARYSTGVAQFQFVFRGGLIVAQSGRVIGRS